MNICHFKPVDAAHLSLFFPSWDNFLCVYVRDRSTRKIPNTRDLTDLWSLSSHLQQWDTHPPTMPSSTGLMGKIQYELWSAYKDLVCMSVCFFCDTNPWNSCWRLSGSHTTVIWLLHLTTGVCIWTSICHLGVGGKKSASDLISVLCIPDHNHMV